MIDDTSLFNDAADVLEIENPAIVEKDYFVVQLLKSLFELELSGYKLVFCGGTCLSKAYVNIGRMSEDVDIKFIPDATIQALTNAKQRESRKELYKSIEAHINKNPSFNITGDPYFRNESRFQKIIISYPRDYSMNALRPELQLELTESELLDNRVLSKPVKSLYAQAAKKNFEIDSLSCVSAELIASEKLVSILRRTAAWERDNSMDNDPTLIRHVYDLHYLNNFIVDNISAVKFLVEKVIELDKSQFKNRHDEFINDAKSELLFGLQKLKTESIYKKRYNSFLNPLVYKSSPPNWERALHTLEQMADELL